MADVQTIPHKSYSKPLNQIISENDAAPPEVESVGPSDCRADRQPVPRPGLATVCTEPRESCGDPEKRVRLTRVRLTQVSSVEGTLGDRDVTADTAGTGGQSVQTERSLC